MTEPEDALVTVADAAAAAAAAADTQATAAPVGEKRKRDALHDDVDDAVDYGDDADDDGDAALANAADAADANAAAAAPTDDAKTADDANATGDAARVKPTDQAAVDADKAGDADADASTATDADGDAATATPATTADADATTTPKNASSSASDKDEMDAYDRASFAGTSALASFGPSAYLYSLANYTLGSKSAQREKDAHAMAKMSRFRAQFERQGARRVVEAVLLVHQHKHPHVLLLSAGAHNNFFKLPGGKLRPGEDEHKGLIRKLNARLAPSLPAEPPRWEVVELLGQFHRTRFPSDAEMAMNGGKGVAGVLYPYKPAHVSRAVETKKVFLVQAPERALFAVPSNFQLVAIPLFDLLNQSDRYGPVISAIPTLVSRFSNVYL